MFKIRGFPRYSAREKLWLSDFLGERGAESAGKVAIFFSHAQMKTKSRCKYIASYMRIKVIRTGPCNIYMYNKFIIQILLYRELFFFIAFHFSVAMKKRRI